MIGDYLAGFVAVALATLPWVVAGHRLGRKLLPEWDPVPHVVVSALLAVSGILLVAEVLGACEVLNRWSMAGSSAAVAAAVAWWSRPPASTAPSSGAGRPGKMGIGALLAAVCVLAVSAGFVARDVQVLRTGPTDLDSMQYHLSQAAYFAQTGSIDHIHQTRVSDGTQFYPFDVELLDTVAMFGPHPDVAVLVLNLLFLWLAFVACWMIGARWSLAPPAVAGLSFVFALPLVVGASSGPGLNDVPAVAFLLAAIAVASHAEQIREARWLTAAGICGLALGLAGGTKVPVLELVPFIALTLVAVAPARRWATLGTVSGAAVVTGGFWYIRNWVLVGSPMPDVDLTIAGHGLHGVPHPLIARLDYTVAHYATNGDVIHHFFIPQMRAVFTPLWPALLILAIFGIVDAIIEPADRFRRMLGVTTAIGFVLYLFTPTGALGPPGQPLLFGSNLRYAIPAFSLALLLAATAPVLRRVSSWVALVLTVLTVVALTSSRTAAYLSWRDGARAGVALALAAGAVLAVRRTDATVLTAAAAVAGLIVVGGVGYAAQRHYLGHRYGDRTPTGLLYGSANRLQHQRIGVIGPLQYPFFGPKLDNIVTAVGHYEGRHYFAPATTCTQLRQDLAAGRYQFVVIEPDGIVPTTADTYASWVGSLPGARPLVQTAAGSMVALPAAITAVGCDAAGPTSD